MVSLVVAAHVVARERFCKLEVIHAGFAQQEGRRQNFGRVEHGASDGVMTHKGKTGGVRWQGRFARCGSGRTVGRPGNRQWKPRLKWRQESAKAGDEKEKAR